jgi:nitrate/nitrite transporter NarK
MSTGSPFSSRLSRFPLAFYFAFFSTLFVPTGGDLHDRLGILSIRFTYFQL